jgi:hypothetical protein
MSGRKKSWISAFAACAIAIAAGVSAQDKPDLWFEQMRLPSPEAQAILLDRVQQIPASAFDPGLPPTPLETWLFITLSPHAQVVNARFVDWLVFFCGPYAPGENPSIVLAGGPELCAIGTVQFSAERIVKLVVKVADAVRENMSWRPVFPSLKDVYVERIESPNRPTRIDSLDVPKLGDLLEMLQLPFDKWPQVDFDTAITWDPPRPQPGRSVRFSLWVRNTGKRTADRAWITLWVAPCCDPKREVHRDWTPKLAPGESVRVDWEFPLPEGMAFASVSVRPSPSRKMVRFQERRSSEVQIPPRDGRSSGSTDAARP